MLENYNSFQAANAKLIHVYFSVNVLSYSLCRKLLLKGFPLIFTLGNSLIRK